MLNNYYIDLIIEAANKMKNEENKTDTLTSLLDSDKINEIRSIGLNGKNHLKPSSS